MEKIYIARKFIAIEGGARHLYEEEVFDSYESAFKFIKDISEEDEDVFLSEIVSFVLNDALSRNKKEIFIFDKTANPIWSSNVSPKPDSFVGKYSVGDIVKVQAFPWDPFSPTWVSTIGVVAKRPIHLEEWLMSGNNKDSWDNTYIIECIRSGYLGHWHVKECSIELFQQKMPDNLRFLQILSAHYLGYKTLPTNVFESIQSGKLFIEKIDHFNFDIFG